MAHGVKRSTGLTIGQALHGYADGHRQLALSAPLRPRDIRTMLVLSDLSGAGIQIDETGYLTGYPLNESKIYAIARTWAAPEMPRPGCVWTHTLLIDFADLAGMSDFNFILSLFRRPTGANTSEYSTTLEARASVSTEGIEPGAEKFAYLLLSALYGFPKQGIIASRPNSVGFERVVLALLAQQWPRLRRVFRFCTLAASDRSTDGALFDLQLLPSLERSVRARFDGATEALEPIEREAWLDTALNDLVHPNTNQFRTYLQRIGGDVASGREAFRSLCQLHALIQEFETVPDAVNLAITLLDRDLGSDQARSARGIVASAVLEHSRQLEAEPADFLLRNLDLAEPEAFAKGGELLGRALWRQNPSTFNKLMVGGERQRQVVERTLASLADEDLVSGIARSPNIARMVLSYRPDLLALDVLWRRDLVPVEAISTLLNGRSNLRADVVAAIVSAGRIDLASHSISAVGELTLLQIVAAEFNRSGSDPETLAIWLKLVVLDSAVLAQFLAEQKVVSWDLLSAIASLVTPDSVPNDYGDDPWLMAAQVAASGDKSSAPAFLAAFLLSRALGLRSRNPGELAQFGFEAVHNAAEQNLISDHAWDLLKLRLPWSFNWFDWDRCQRIRAAVAELFVARDLAPQAFSSITRDARLFAILAATVAGGSHGRQYLKRVRRWMKDSNPQQYSGQIWEIEKLTR